ncbi:MAG: hypothetical protein CVT86_03235 [Alphaproteobacteria bacterium HGW-Alphaproteobacteria-8]|jgi:tetrahydromethanopterin S-methyltransferase subunit G|nr:MAG: hypothetical protein CVT86_03235 [Alphaproteobacteria bacterium HGW-Alphaproteobacteria-8]
MTDDRADLMLEILKRLQAGQSRLEEKVDRLASEFVGMKQHMAAFMTSEFHQDAEIAALKLRLDRIERRLDLTDG